jgi:hypothetical protein
MTQYIAEAGKDDIRYTYLVGQDGLVYEGRGFGITGQYTDDGQDHKSIGTYHIGAVWKAGWGERGFLVIVVEMLRYPLVYAINSPVV